MGSHFYTAFYASETFFKSPTVFNWDFNWFAGYVPFIFYMPLTFVLMTVLDIFLPLQVAFKLVVISGIFLTPPAVYYLIKSFRLDKTYASLGAVLSLVFLFNNNMGSSAQIWGGTTMSVLAGEFAQSLSIAIGLFFIGAFWKMLNLENKKLWPVFLLAAIPITHPLSFLWISIVALGLFSLRFSKDNLFYCAKMAGIFLLFDAFWLAPTLIYKSKYFLNLASVWAVKFADILPQSIAFWPIFLIPAFLNERKKHQDFALFAVFGMGSAVLLSVLAIKIGIYPVRFYPYLQLSFVLSGVFILATLGKKIILIFPLIFIIAIGYFIIQHRYNPVSSWIKWNFEGLEAKTNADHLIQAHESLKGGVADPRVMVEFTSENNDTGTPRNNEIVPLLAGRQTLEGVYMFSSVTNPFIFKLQSEISTDRSCQTDIIGLKCGDVDYELGTEHLKIFNVSHLIIRSNKIKNILSERKDFKKLEIFGPYETWEFLSNENKYVTVPKFQPLFYTGGEEWKKASFEWFNKKEILDIPVVFDLSKRELAEKPASLLASDLKSQLNKIPVNQSCSIAETLSLNTVKFKTSCPGIPHIIKVSYFPSWGVEGASKIYLVSPSFMLVYPEKEEVTLKFGGGLFAGFLKSLGVLPLLISGLFISRKALLLRRSYYRG